MLRLIHTADLQIGKPFGGLPEAARPALADARIAALSAVLEAARDCDLVVVAGDFFDSNTVPHQDLVRACDTLAASPVPVHVIPGNHDDGGPGSIWRSDELKRLAPPCLRVHLDREPVVVAEGRGILLPAPLLRRHEAGETTAHVTAELGAGLGERDAVRVALAHGGVVGFEGDGEAVNLVDAELPRRADLDYLALGDWHGCKQVGERAWYSGAPEPDRFAVNRPGFALRVELQRGCPPVVTELPTATFSWLRWSEHLAGPEDLARLRSRLEELERPGQTLLRLQLSGALSFGGRDTLQQVLRDAEARLHVLRRRGAVAARPGDEELAALRGEGWLGQAVDELVGRQDDVAARAVELLHSLRFGGSP